MRRERAVEEIDLHGAAGELAGEARDAGKGGPRQRAAGEAAHDDVADAQGRRRAEALADLVGEHRMDGAAAIADRDEALAMARPAVGAPDEVVPEPESQVGMLEADQREGGPRSPAHPRSKPCRRPRSSFRDRTGSRTKAH